jgi:hypothetical protein
VLSSLYFQGQLKQTYRNPSHNTELDGTNS